MKALGVFFHIYLTLLNVKGISNPEKSYKSIKELKEKLGSIEDIDKSGVLP
jgi:hypothetical protein